MHEQTPQVAVAPLGHTSEACLPTTTVLTRYEPEPGGDLTAAAKVVPMVLLAAAYVVTTTLPAIGPTVNGLTAGVVGILLATTYRLGKPNIQGPLTWGIALGAFAAGVFLGVSAALIVVAAGLLGMVLLTPPGATPHQTGKEGWP